MEEPDPAERGGAAGEGGTGGAGRGGGQGGGSPAAEYPELSRGALSSQPGCFHVAKAKRVLTAAKKPSLSGAEQGWVTVGVGEVVSVFVTCWRCFACIYLAGT